MNPTIRKVFIVYYYYVLYAPLFFGIPRYDFIGFVISLTYSWTFLINIIGLGSEQVHDTERWRWRQWLHGTKEQFRAVKVRDYDCEPQTDVYLFLAPQYIGWITLCLLQIYTILYFSCPKCENRLEKKTRINFKDSVRQFTFHVFLPKKCSLCDMSHVIVVKVLNSYRRQCTSNRLKIMMSTVEKLAELSKNSISSPNCYS